MSGREALLVAVDVVGHMAWFRWANVDPRSASSEKCREQKVRFFLWIRSCSARHPSCSSQATGRQDARARHTGHQHREGSAAAGRGGHDGHGVG